MQTQLAPAAKPVVNAIVDKKPVTNLPAKTESKPEKKPKYMKYGAQELALSLQRKRARKVALESALKILESKIEAREKRLKEISPKQ